MRVLVTGASGFVGTHVVQCLLERRQHTVFCLYREATAVAPSGATALIGNIESENSLAEAIAASRCQVVVNLAGIYAWWLPDPSVYDRVNVDGVAKLLNVCAAAKSGAVRLVHVSTALAYGRCCAPSDVFTEDTLPGSHASIYAASKHRGDALAQAAFDAGRLAGCTLFLGCCIGADPKLLDPRKDVMRIAELITGALPATVSSATIFTYVAVRDAAEAIVRATEKADHRQGDRWLIGDQRLPTREYYKLLAELSGTPSPSFEVPGWFAMGSAKLMTGYSSWVSGRPPTAPADVVRTATYGTLCFDAGKSKRELGMSYTPIRTAFAEAVDYLTDHLSGAGKVAAAPDENEGLHLLDGHATVAVCDVSEPEPEVVK